MMPTNITMVQRRSQLSLFTEVMAATVASIANGRRQISRRIKATAGVVPAGGGCSSRVGLEAESAAFVVISVSPSLADSLAEAYLSGCVYWLDDAAAENETGRSVPSSGGHDPPEFHGCRALN